MLISDAVERAVAQMDFTVLRGSTVFLDSTYLDGMTDSKFIISTMRQHLLASGCAIRDTKGEAEFIIEARAGTIGTDRHDLLYGMPAVNLGSISPVPGVPTAIPEIALARRTDQQAVAKLAVFAYHRETGRPVWQSGSDAVASKARDLWVFGAGPFQRGTIYEGTHFAGGELAVPLMGSDYDQAPDSAPVTLESTFNAPQSFAKKKDAADPKLAQKPAAPATAKSEPEEKAAEPVKLPDVPQTAMRPSTSKDPASQTQEIIGQPLWPVFEQPLPHDAVQPATHMTDPIWR